MMLSLTGDRVAKKKALPPSMWEGFCFPARLLTSDECEILSPVCDTCNLEASVVELQYPLTPKIERTKLIEFTNGDIKFYCGHHAPITVPDEVIDQTDYAFYLKMREPVHCEKKGYQKHPVVCLKHHVACRSSCPMVGQQLSGMSIDTALKIIENGHAIYEQKAAAAAKDK